MKIKEGQLCFIAGDRIEVESKGFETMSLVAMQGQKCEKCEFCPICDKSNKNNMIGHFCTETHFEQSKH